MNDRIRLLAEQASEIDGDDLLYYNPVFAEKFAELIVRECMGVVGNKTCPNYAYKAIQTHFGVK